MRRRFQPTLDRLEQRLPLSVSVPVDDDPPPEPEPAPPPYPGDNPPIIYPLAPPSGPAGPG